MSLSVYECIYMHPQYLRLDMLTCLTAKAATFLGPITVINYYTYNI